MKGIGLIVQESFNEWDEYLIAYHRKINSGYHIYSGHNEDVQRMFGQFKASSIPIVWTGLPEILVTEGLDEFKSIRTLRLKVFGKELEGVLEKKFTIVLVAVKQKTSTGKIEHRFQVHGDTQVPAKTPMGMFKDDFIDNDLALVVKACRDYYDGDCPHMLMIGESGSGKSASLRNLDPATTAIINIERKQLPFPGANKFKHHFMVPETMPKDAEELPGIVLRETRALLERLTGCRGESIAAEPPAATESEPKKGASKYAKFKFK